MGTNEVLSQDEVDALLNGVESGDVDTEGAQNMADGEVRPYDLTSQERMARARMPALDMLNERFARYFGVSLLNMLSCSCEISAQETQTTKLADYINGLSLPTNLNLVKIKPLRGTALIVLDPELVFTAVENFFGGDGRFDTKIEDREFTALEMRVVRLILKPVFEDLKAAWKPVAEVEFEYLDSEVNPQFANVVSPTELVVVTSFQVQFDKGAGNLDVIMPYAMLQPLREVLAVGVQSDPLEFDERWTSSLREEIKEAAVDLSCTLAKTEITLRELTKLSPGDVIPVDLPALVTTKVEGIPMFHCHYGISRGCNAVQIMSPTQRPNHGE